VALRVQWRLRTMTRLLAPSLVCLLALCVALAGSASSAMAQDPVGDRAPSLPLSSQGSRADNPFAGSLFDSAPPESSPFAPMLGFDLSANPVIRAQISPRRQTVLSAEIAGKIADLDLREGDRFRAGDRLIGLDCAAHSARRDRAHAQEQASRRRLETAGRLDQLSSISRLEYDEAIAALAAAEAESTLAELFVSRCVIEAPFDGRVSGRLAEPFQYVAEGEPLIAILDDQDLEVELIAPSRWLVWLRPGHRFSVHVDELADDILAEVARLGARVDPVSQSVKVFATIKDAPTGLMAGMSGLADLAPPPKAPPPGAPDG
jgi:membrane fusion protein (multidrug efflux system)